MLSLDPDYYAARERVEGKPGTLPDTQPRTGTIVIGDTLRLFECRVLTPTVRIGEHAKLLFQWEALAPVDPSWKVFVHIRRRLYGGALIDADHRFRELGRAPEDWAIGTALAYELDVLIPAASPGGEYSVLIGIWDREKVLPAAKDRADAGTPRMNNDQILVGRFSILRPD